MIPKIIHYCWFGGNPLPELAQKCLASWKKRCPDYEIRRWDERNFDISRCPRYVRQAYDAKMWPFVSDYVRLQVVYDHGGIYLDTDVELKKSLDPLLSNGAWFGFENGEFINTGLGFGAEKHCPILKELLADYENISFLLPDGSYDTTPCPQRNTGVFVRHGLRIDGSMQLLPGNIRVLPPVYLCPIDYETGLRKRSRKTVAIHRYAASWHTQTQRQEMRENQRRNRNRQRRMALIRFPLAVAKKLLGKARYAKIRSILRGR